MKLIEFTFHIAVPFEELKMFSFKILLNLIKKCDRSFLEMVITLMKRYNCCDFMTVI